MKRLLPPMKTRKEYLIKPLSRDGQPAALELLRSARHAHRHLDWLDEQACIHAGPGFTASIQGKPDALLVCPPEAPGTAWIRLFAVRPGASPSSTFQLLWHAASRLLQDKHIHTAAVMVLADWFEAPLKQSGFTFEDQVVFLELDLPSRVDFNSQNPCIRRFHPQDLHKVQNVDEQAFSTIWQHAPASIEAAVHRASYVTVFESENRILGYQASTQTAFGAHLARLAVVPEAQNRGIGTALVYDLVDHFSEMGMFRITVNTQGRNLASQQLYRKAGFLMSNLQYPVYTSPV